MGVSGLSTNARIQRDLAAIYSRAHNAMRNMDGMQPQEAFDELLKYLFFKQVSEDAGVQPPPAAAAIRTKFSQYLEKHNLWSTDLWRDRSFRLSDGCLEQCNSLFSELRFSEIACDIRSAAIREFLTPDIRKGLGIYLTPDEIVREIVRFVDPPPSARCLDPACGSGTFLIEILRHWRDKDSGKHEIWGADKNPRMLLLAELNLGHFADIVFSRRLMDSLTEPSTQHQEQWCRHGYFDFVLTNPPFGVVIETDRSEYSSFDTARDDLGLPRPRQASEWLFVEQCLRWLKPGGTLAIVLPKSVITNPSSSFEREAIGNLGYLRAIITLPPETFSMTGTQTNAIVAIFDKYHSISDRKQRHSVTVAALSNVGYDSTGRPRTGSQLHDLAAHMRHVKISPVDYISVIPDVPASTSLSVLTAASASKRRENGGIRLGDLTERLATGRTPPRVAYSDSGGLFLVKVGNLTGTGINWIARSRNYIDTKSVAGRRFKSDRLLKAGDIVLTSSAHSPVYIAKKVDIVTDIPSWVGGAASLVGEVMLVRVNPNKISPFVLLGFLRQPAVNREIQGMIRGQTAHLYPADLAELRVPEKLLDPSSEWQTLRDVLKEESLLNERLNELAHRQIKIFEEIATLN